MATAYLRLKQPQRAKDLLDKAKRRDPKNADIYRAVANCYRETHDYPTAISTLSARPEYPDFSRRGNPEHRVVAFGKWGTYKRLELLIEAFKLVAAQMPNLRLIIAGANHPDVAGARKALRYRFHVPRGPPVPMANAPAPQKPAGEPVGTATAERTPTAGGAASKPAGTAIAPAKQRQVRSLLIKLGAVAGAGVALGTVMALSRSTPSVPPGAKALGH